MALQYGEGSQRPQTTFVCLVAAYLRCYKETERIIRDIRRRIDGGERDSVLFTSLEYYKSQLRGFEETLKNCEEK